MAVHGIETYCLHDALFKHEYGDTLDAYNTMQKKLNMQSNRLASCVQKQALEHVNKQQPLHDRKVKHAVTQLLLGANAPGILVELGFVTHPEEAKRLASKPYQQMLAEGIAAGIDAYLI